MQKQKIIYLVIQSTYDQVEIALLEKSHLLDMMIVPKFVASGQLIPVMDTILQRNNLTLDQISFIGANLGPAPFTTLRTTISTLNGINFATKIPLVGVNGIATLIQEVADTPAIAILNAYGNSLYYATKSEIGIRFGWEMAKPFWDQQVLYFNNIDVLVIGEGLSHLKNWDITLPSNFKLNLHDHKFSNIKSIASGCLNQYLNEQLESELQPLYLKSAIPVSFQNRPNGT